MSWSDIFLPSSAQTSDEAKTNFDRQNAQLAARLAARESAGTINPEQDASYHALLDNNTLIDQDTGTLDAFLNDAAYKAVLRANGQEEPASVTDLILDLVILAALLGSIWLFGSFGGFIWTRQLISKKNTVGMVGLGLAVTLWLWGLYYYGKKAWSDFSSVKDQGLSLFGL